MRIGIIFDVDGTLWDSSEQVAESWMHTMTGFPEVKVPCTKEAIRSVMGKTMLAIRDYFMPDLPVEKSTAILKECEKNEILDLKKNLPPVFDGVPETMRALAKEYTLFIVSNAQTGYIELCIESAGVADVITDYRCFGDNELPKDGNIRLIADKYHLERFFYVGDIQADYDATVKAHGEFIHAAYGFGIIRAEVPRIDDITELPNLMKSLV